MTSWQRRGRSMTVSDEMRTLEENAKLQLGYDPVTKVFAIILISDSGSVLSNIIDEDRFAELIEQIKTYSINEQENETEKLMKDILSYERGD